MSERRAPDILIDYGKNAKQYPYHAIIYVRPETNTIKYEKALLAAVSTIGKVVYMANLNGSIFLSDGILKEHYASQLKFGENPVAEFSRFPELVELFEHHFECVMGKIELVGAFEAVESHGFTPQTLFKTLVSNQHYFHAFGQTVKLINGLYIVNSELPAIFEKYTEESNVFVIAVHFNDIYENVFNDLGEAVFHEVTSDRTTPLIDLESLPKLAWNERIKRTFHLSRNHIMGFYDGLDFIYETADSRIGIEKTHFGRKLSERNCGDVSRILELRRQGIVRLPAENGKAKLIYLPEAANEQTLEKSADIIASALLSLK